MSLKPMSSARISKIFGRSAARAQRQIHRTATNANTDLPTPLMWRAFMDGSWQFSECDATPGRVRSPLMFQFFRCGLEGSSAEQEVHNIPFVGLEPIELDSR